MFSSSYPSGVVVTAEGLGLDSHENMLSMASCLDEPWSNLNGASRYKQSLYKGIEPFFSQLTP